jgi:hypothetical protein
MVVYTEFHCAEYNTHMYHVNDFFRATTECAILELTLPKVQMYSLNTSSRSYTVYIKYCGPQKAMHVRINTAIASSYANTFNGITYNITYSVGVHNMEGKN